MGKREDKLKITFISIVGLAIILIYLLIDAHLLS